jgi:hypothetical protein
MGVAATFLTGKGTSVPGIGDRQGQVMVVSPVARVVLAEGPGLPAPVLSLDHPDRHLRDDGSLAQLRHDAAHLGLVEANGATELRGISITALKNPPTQA